MLQSHVAATCRKHIRLTCKKGYKTLGAVLREKKNNSPEVVPAFEPVCDSVSLNIRGSIVHVSGVTV